MHQLGSSTSDEKLCVECQIDDVQAKIPKDATELCAYDQTVDSEEQHNGERLCTECGMCCDGTIFARTPLSVDDDTHALEQAGCSVVDRTGGLATMVQPCPALDGHRCSVYAARPSICADYRCELLRRVEKQSMTCDDALDIVREAANLRSSIRRRLSATVGEQASIRLFDLAAGLDLHPGGAVGPGSDDVEVMLDLGALVALVERHFHTRLGASAVPVQMGSKT